MTYPVFPRHPVARRLFARLTLVGLVLAVSLATGQLYIEYRHDVATLENRLNEIEASYLPSVRENTWLDDRERLDVLADGIRNLPAIAHVIIRAPDGEILAQAGAPAAHPLTRGFDIVRDYSGRQLNLGRLEVTAGLESLRQSSLQRLWFTLATDFLLVFALAALLYGQVHALVTGRLKAIANYARRLGKDGPAQTPVLRVDAAGNGDEFADLGFALARMHTDLTAAHGDLAASEGRYRELFTSSPVSLWEEDFSAVKAALQEVPAEIADVGAWLEANPDFVRRCAGLVRILDVNDASIAMHRAGSRGELLTRLSGIFTPSSYDAFRRQLEAIHAGHHELTQETQVRTLDGDTLEIVLHWHVPRAHHGSYTRVIVSQEDVSALKAARISSDMTLERLMQANAELERFAFVTSHDLQEPVRSVVSFAQLLERHLSTEGGLSQDAQEYLGFLRAAAERMRAQVAGLQDYVRAGQGHGAFAPFALDDALADARAMLGDILNDCTVRVIAPPLPTIIGDRAQLAQLFRQLLDNAIKFRRPDTAPVITVAALREDGQWRVTVQDNGIGIDAAYAATVFEVFRRLHGPGRYPGAGIGLAICRRIVQRHGGTIAIDSGVGDGTAVTFTLPADNLASAAPGQ